MLQQSPRVRQTRDGRCEINIDGIITPATPATPFVTVTLKGYGESESRNVQSTRSCFGFPPWLNAVNPTHARFVPSRTPVTNPRSSGTVSTVVPFTFNATREEYLGAERLLYGEVDGAKAVARFPSTADISAHPGRALEFVVPRQHLRIFDRETGLRVRE